MNKKQLIIAAMAAVLSVSSASATSYITDVTNGGSGSFNIKPDQISGDVGYRYYDQFKLGESDIANLIYQGYKNGNIRDINSFINLVGGTDKVTINGILNTLAGDGSFKNGHAVFISPNGMVVGASGVINVGTLSIVTPTSNKFNELKTGYNNADFSTINDISTLKNGSGMNYGGNAPVQINGKILTRGVGQNSSKIGVDIRGSQVDIAGKIINGYAGTNVFSTASQAETLFNSLVNTDGTIKAGSSLIASDAGNIIIKSGSDVSTTNKGGINITGKIANLGTKETAITNHGSNGLTVSGVVATNGKLNVYNNNALSNLTVSGTLTNKNNVLSVSNTGKNLNVTSTGKLVTDNALEVVNNGKNTTSQLIIAGSAISKGKTDIVNRGKDGMNITGTVGNTTTPTIRIVNENGKLAFSGNARATEAVSFINQADTSKGISGTGMEIGGIVTAGEEVLVHNKVGNANLKGSINVENGNITVYNQGTGKLTTTTESRITNEGNVSIKNESTGGMELGGIINNEGEVAINNLAGAAVVNGTINNTGNMGIINKANGTGLTIGGRINNEGKIKLVNSTGANGLTVNGIVKNSTGNLYLYNDAGHTTINGTLQTTEAGNLYVLSRNASTGITTSTASQISNEGGHLAIKHNGKNAKNSTGMSLNGTITNDGEIAINNYSGNMLVNGTITQEGNANIGIINRAASEDSAKTGIGGTSMTVNAKINGSNINIKNNGSGNMTVNGEITHNGRLNVLANEGNLVLGGKIHNTGKDITYAAARANGDGITVTDSFAADSNNGGTILIKNITGQNGLTYDGSMTATNGGQAEVYNKAGNMTVNGKISGTPSVILNTGKKLTVTDTSELSGDIIIANKGSEKATVAEKYERYLRQKINGAQ